MFGPHPEAPHHHEHAGSVTAITANGSGNSVTVTHGMQAANGLSQIPEAGSPRKAAVTASSADVAVQVDARGNSDGVTAAAVTGATAAVARSGAGPAPSPAAVMAHPQAFATFHTNPLHSDHPHPHPPHPEQLHDPSQPPHSGDQSDHSQGHNHHHPQQPHNHHDPQPPHNRHLRDSMRMPTLYRQGSKIAEAVGKTAHALAHKVTGWLALSCG